MENYSSFIIHNKSNTEIGSKCNIDKLYSLFLEKLKFVSEILNNNSIDEDDWDLKFVREEAIEMMKIIENTFIKNKSLDWRIQISNIIASLIDKNKNSFSIADEMYSGDMERCEQYYDLLSNIFYNTEEIISIKYEKYTRTSQTYINNSSIRVNVFSGLNNQQGGVKYNTKIKNNTKTSSDYKLAA